MFHAQIATEVGKFSVADVVDALSNKMVRRHPHVFGDAVIEDVDAQWRNWERLKALEKTGRSARAGSTAFPSISARCSAASACRKRRRASASIGRTSYGVLDKLTEELHELAEARRQPQDDPRVREELGDVFFTLVNLSRALGIDAETAMREANEKFYRRFAFMEERAAADGKTSRRSVARRTRGIMAAGEGLSGRPARCAWRRTTPTTAASSWTARECSRSSATWRPSC